MEARGVGQDPLVAKFQQAISEGMKHRRERIARGEPLPPFVDNPTPAEQLLRDSAAISEEFRTQQ